MILNLMDVKNVITYIIIYNINNDYLISISMNDR